METVFFWVFIVVALLAVVGGVYFYITRRKTHRFARLVVSAVYRVALNFAAQYGDKSLEWLRSEEGVTYRHQLVAEAYDLLPGFIGPVPVGLIKAYISRDKFILLVDSMFNEAANIAANLEHRDKFVATDEVRSNPATLH